jgi:two-component system LytT family sensor kinase
MNLNRTLGEGIAQLLSEQLLRYRYENQKNLLVQSELKLIQAQVNPHFLFNALNTIIAVVRIDADQARSLLLHLSNYFRKNLKRSGDLATLEEELDHVNSYLVIQRARFGDKLKVEQDVDPQLLNARLPTFTLQPIVENAVKHGISNMLGAGVVKILAYKEDHKMIVAVEDDAGAYCEKLTSDGLGMNIVDKRIKSYFGRQYGTKIDCIPGSLTRVQLTFPYEKEEPS